MSSSRKDLNKQKKRQKATRFLEPGREIPNLCKTHAHVDHYWSLKFYSFYLNFMRILPYSLFQPAEILWRDLPSGIINHSSQFCVLCRLTEDVVCSIIKVKSKDVNQYLPEYWFLEYSASDCPPTGLSVFGYSTEPGSSACCQSTSLFVRLAQSYIIHSPNHLIEGSEIS